MIRMRQRPGADLLEALDIGEDAGAEVDVLDVHHLQAGLRHGRDIVGRDFLVRQGHAGRPRVMAAERVVIDVQLERPRAIVELLGQRRMRIVQPAPAIRRGAADDLHDRLGNGLVIAVVGADRQDVGHAQIVVHPGPRAALAGAGRVRRIQIALGRHARLPKTLVPT